MANSSSMGRTAWIAIGGPLQLGQLEQLASPMRAARRLGDRTWFASGNVETVEAGICISLHDAAVVGQVRFGMLAAAIGRVGEDRRRWRRPGKRLV